MMDRQRVEMLLSSWWHELGNRYTKLRRWFQRVSTQDISFLAIKSALARTCQQRLRLIKCDAKISAHELRLWFRQHQRALALYAALPASIILLMLVIQQQTVHLSNKLALRPAQQTAIQALIDASKSDAVTDSTTALTENDIETLRVILQNRGITPNMLQLKLDQDESLEFQTDQANFGQWVAFLEEAARRWHLFPVQITIKAGDSPEIVSIRATLKRNAGGRP